MIIVHMIGNAHIDPVWLWGWQAGVDEALSTLSAAADRCDEYPDFRFTCGESWLYQQVERLRPALFARIRRHVASGQWFIAGGTYVQPDLNLPTWTALQRQIRHGQAYFQSRFGVAPQIGYNVDSFGQSAFLPDLFTAYGYTACVFGRPGPDQVPLPFSAFMWRGAGGAELPAFRIYPGYAESVPDLRQHVERALTQSDPGLGHAMCFYGVGNHGGGPTRRQIDWILAHRLSMPGIELRMSTPADFFAAIAPLKERLPMVAGELQHCFPGCYSAMGGIKRTQRHGEHLLDQAERAARAFAADPVARASMADKIDAAWQDLLFTGFHDIVTGTSTPPAWASCEAMQGRARITGEEVLLDVTRNWADGALPPAEGHEIVVINTDDVPFDGIVDHETWLDHEPWEERYLADSDGAPILLQRAQPDSGFRVPRLLFPLRVAPRGATRVRILHPPASIQPDNASDLRASPTRLCNDRLDVALGPNGVTGIRLDGRSLLGHGGITLQLRDDHSDTWGATTDKWAEPVSATLRDVVWEVEEAGPLRASVHVHGRMGTSRLRWALSLHRGEPCLRMRLEVNFDERFTLLQLPVLLPHGMTSRVDAVPGGAISRPLCLTEYPMQGWSRLEFPDHDLALVTQDAFSLSVTQETWQVTLLRSPRMAWPGSDPPIYHHRDYFTDQGVHTLHFELHADARLTDAELNLAARRMAQPLISFERTERADRPF